MEQSEAAKAAETLLAAERAMVWAIRAENLESYFRSLSGQTPSTVSPLADSVEGNNVAVVRLSGVLVQGEPRNRGEVSYESIRNVVARLQDDVQVKNIVLHWNSPGGMAAGARETGEWLRRHSAAGGAKPVYSYSDALLASAAYAVAAGSDKIWASESAEVGSIGVILAIADMRRMYEQFGVQMEIFASSELKWTGFPGTSLTPGQREDLQRTVSEFAMVFYEWIAVSRPNAQVEVLDGATFTGRRGRELGLVDELAPDVGELVKHLS